MQIINEQYKDKCLYSDFRTVDISDEITSIKYSEDGSCVVKIKAEYPFCGFTILKKV